MFIITWQYRNHMFIIKSSTEQAKPLPLNIFQSEEKTRRINLSVAPWKNINKQRTLIYVFFQQHRLIENIFRRKGCTGGNCRLVAADSFNPFNSSHSCIFIYVSHPKHVVHKPASSVGVGADKGCFEICNIMSVRSGDVASSKVGLLWIWTSAGYIYFAQLQNKRYIKWKCR